MGGLYARMLGVGGVINTGTKLGVGVVLEALLRPVLEAGRLRVGYFNF